MVKRQSRRMRRGGADNGVWTKEEFIILWVKALLCPNELGRGPRKTFDPHQDS